MLFKAFSGNILEVTETLWGANTVVYTLYEKQEQETMPINQFKEMVLRDAFVKIKTK